MYIFDFDGTIVDLWVRYYSVFKDILEFDKLCLSEYKRAKQSLHQDSLIANYFNKNLPKDYFTKKTALLEDRRYLEKDMLLVDLGLLNSLLAKDAIILTKRRNAENFYWQMFELGIHGKAIVIQNGNKKDWVATNLDNYSRITIVGDSLADLEVSQLDKAGAWMVGYGLATKKEFDATGLPYRYFETPEEIWNEFRGRF